MSVKNEIKELRQYGKAASAVGFILLSTLPMFILGWLLSAVARHPKAEEMINSELVYKFLMWWQGGNKSFPIIFLLMLLLSFVIFISYVLRKNGYSHPFDGMERGRIILRKILIPAFLSYTAFAGGITSGSSIYTMKGSGILVLVFTLFAGIVHYLADQVDID